MKKIFIITLFLLCLLTIGAVSAANNDTAVSSDVNDDTDTVLAQEDEKALSRMMMNLSSKRITVKHHSRH